MPRVARVASGGVIYHVLNRGVGKMTLFRSRQDFQAFQRCLVDTLETTPIRVLAYCAMSNHWHLVLWPERDGQLTAFMRQLTLTHAQRWKHAHNAVGHGHLYQGRFKSLPVQSDEHLLTVLRYVERNPLRAGLVKRAEQWPWGGCHVRREPKHALAPLLAEWPVARPPNWTRWVNEPQTDAEEEALKTYIVRSRPFGDADWTGQTAERLGLEHTLRSPGRQIGWRKRKRARE